MLTALNSSRLLNNPRTSKAISFFGLVVLLVISGLSYWSARNYQTSANWRIHTDKVVAEIRGLRTAIEAAESANRGYVITNQEVFTEAFNRERLKIKTDSEQVAELIKDNSLQSNRFAAAMKTLDLKLKFLSEVDAQVKKGQPAGAVALIKGGHGRVLMDQLSAAFLEIENEELNLMTVRSLKADRDFSRIAQIVFVGLLGTFLLLVASNILVRTEIDLRMRSEKDLILANKKALDASNMKSSFLANMSHEIRTPLNGIIGMSKLLEQTELDERQVDFVDTIKTSSNSLLALINEILDLSKIESGKLQLEEANFELGSLIKSTISIVEFPAKAKGLQIVTEIAPDVPDFFLGDPLRLRQVLLNLLNNAVKFSERGTIQVKISKRREFDSSITLHFDVIDQGVGLDPETRAKLFQSFTQGDDSTSRKYGGSGLGLAISRQIVEMMNGLIDVESIKGVGSRFFFEVSLRVAKYGGPTQEASFDRMVPKKLGGYVLIAEDNKVNQKVVFEMVNLLGCASKIVENGEQAIEALKKEEFNLVLMDGQMPVMDGYDSTKLIRAGKAGEANKNIPVVATTANAIKGDIERCLEAGMNDYIGKPISYDDLAFKVEKWMTRGKSIIDDKSLEKLRELGAKSGSDLLRELIALFSVEGPQTVAKMREHLNAGEFVAISRLAHSMKSSASNLGALRLRELAERLERAKTGATEQHVLSLINSLEKELDLVLNDLSRRI